MSTPKKRTTATDKTITRMVTKSLPCKLEESEVLQYGRDIARAHADKDRIEDDFDLEAFNKALELWERGR
jgi:hypothetical protein